MFVIKSLPVHEMPMDKETLQSADKSALISPELPDTSPVPRSTDEIQTAVGERTQTSSSIGRVLRSTKATGTNNFSSEYASAVSNDELQTQISATSATPKTVEVEPETSKDTSTTDLKKVPEVIKSILTQEYANGDVIPSVLSSTSTSSSIVTAVGAKNKENGRPASTAYLGSTSTQLEQTYPNKLLKALQVTNNNTPSDTDVASTVPLMGWNWQDWKAGPSNTENIEKGVTLASRQQHRPEQVGGQEGDSDNKLEDTAAVHEGRELTELQSAFNVKKTSAKQPPVMKLKTKISTDHNTEPQTPSSRQSKVKPTLTIQPGLANAYRSYSETSTGLKTPTPRSATFPTTQAPEPPRTRAATRAMQEASDVSAIAMPSMVKFTPQKNRGRNKTNGRLFADMSSSPVVPTPAQLAKETRILPPKRFQHDSPSNGRVLRSDKQTSAPTAINPTGEPDDLTTHDVLITKSADLQPESSSSTSSSAGKKATPGSKIPRHRQLRDETSRPWKPTDLCQDSVLSYVEETNIAGFAGLKYDRFSENMCRTTKSEREGIFRTSGILMGVRYVMGLGSESTKK